MIIDMDIEAMNMNYVHQWYSKVIDGGFKPGEMSIYYSARRAGKSMLNQYYGKLYDTNLCKEIPMPIKPEPKYKFSRAKWYRADLPIMSSTWHLSNDYNKIIEWCTEQFGPHPARPDAWSRWHVSIGCINFRDERDFVLYQLRWA